MVPFDLKYEEKYNVRQCNKIKEIEFTRNVKGPALHAYLFVEQKISVTKPNKERDDFAHSDHIMGLL